ncbi:MAG: saccharopine dehydrogenase C-terminal domain-containing protein [bacterium]|jgi:lysine 6-dehydrogenase|nr:MAG: saccharopine dehydrogenase [bacterium]
MRALVLGAGLQGSACAYDLLRNDAVERVVLADLNVDRLPPFLEKDRGSPRLELLRLDARDEDAVLAAMGRADACMNALPYYFNLPMAKLAVRAGIHYADLGGNTGIVFQQLELDEQARERGVSVIPDCGLAPGMVNILAAAGIAELDRADTVKIRVGGLPQDPKPPLNYQIVYSLEGVLDYYTTASWVLRDGEPRQVEALTEIESVEFPAPVGTLEAFHTAGGLSTLPWTYQGKVRSMEYKTLRYPGHAEIMRAIRDLGLLGTDPVEVKGQRVVPRELFIACVEPRLRRPEGRDLVALRVEVEGEKDGKPRRIVYDLLDYYDEQTGISAMERTTGFSLAITGVMQVDGRIAKRGVFTPDQGVPAEAYVAELDRRGVRIAKRVE